GPLPAYERVLADACDINFRDGCVRREFLNEINNPWRRLPYSHQASIGLQRQLGTTMAVEGDYVYTGGRGEETAYNVNLGYDPATGANYPFADINRRPFPDWGAVYSEALEGWSNSHGLQTAFTKRFSHRWQASATYTLAALRDADARPFQYGLTNGIVSRAPMRSRSRRTLVPNTRWLPRTSAIAPSSTASGMPDTAFSSVGFTSTAPAAGTATAMVATCATAAVAADRRACVRMGPSFPATRLWEGRFTAWTSASSGVFGRQGITGSMASWKCSTCSTTRTTVPIPPRRATGITGVPR